MERKEYFEKLKDPRWQKKRLAVLKRDKWRCQKCLNDKEMLVVQHKYYNNKFKNPWEYPLEALITLCDDCHQEEYECRQQAEQSLLLGLKKAGFFANDLIEIGWGLYSMVPLHRTEVLAGMIQKILITQKNQQELIDRYLKFLQKVSPKSHLRLTKEWEKINGKIRSRKKLK